MKTVILGILGMVLAFNVSGQCDAEMKKVGYVSYDRVAHSTDLSVQGLKVELDYQATYPPAILILDGDCKYIDFSNSPSLTSIDGIAKKFSKLERISVKGCKTLRQLDPVLSRLEYLEVLDLSESGVKSLDEVVNIKSLKVLKLDGTTISTIPESIANLQNLCVLSLKNTSIETLPKSFLKNNSNLVVYTANEKLIKYINGVNSNIQIR